MRAAGLEAGFGELGVLRHQRLVAGPVLEQAEHELDPDARAANRQGAESHAGVADDPRFLARHVLTVPRRDDDGMAAQEITDAQIAAMPAEERERLILRLARPVEELVPSPSELRRFRRRRLTLMVGATVALVPWTTYLGLTLPQRYVVHNWTLTWVGFDVLLAAMFATTAYLGVRRRQLLVTASFVTGVLLVCDAWFDITTANARDIWYSVADAALVELPAALLLISGAVRLLRITLARLYLIDEQHPTLWSVPLPLRPPEPRSEVG